MSGESQLTNTPIPIASAEKQMASIGTWRELNACRPAGASPRWARLRTMRPVE
ncbi:Uncharacterised protein [Mycobacteroides abscessus subsp. abscessus]|nr:Uncharacterised protein [Mycobacteroides abscessus subsp. abscessus]